MRCLSIILAAAVAGTGTGPAIAADEKKKEEAVELKGYTVGGPGRDAVTTRPSVSIDRPQMGSDLGFSKPELSIAPPPSLPATIPAVMPPGVRPASPAPAQSQAPAVTRAPPVQAPRPTAPAVTRPAATPPGAGSGPTLPAGADPVPVKIDPPDYPRDAALAGIQGEVVIEFTVTVSGDTEDVQVIEAQPRGTFDRAARNAVMRWKFQPMSQAKRIRRTISFNL